MNQDPKEFLIQCYQIAKAHMMLAQVELHMVKQFAEQTLEDVYVLVVPNEDGEEESYQYLIETMPLRIGYLIREMEAIQKVLDIQES